MPRIMLPSLALLLTLFASPTARAGLHYSGEPMAELPSQWRGFLLDQRALRMIAVKPTPPAVPHPERLRYQDALKKLHEAARTRRLSADERADEGALLIRLGEVGRAIEALRAAQRDHPHHFRIIANLGTAYQLQGELGQAAASLREAVRLAPGKYLEAEKAHLRLVELRWREGKGADSLDDLFTIRYVGEMGQYEPGRLAAAERKKLPAEAVAVAQQLALWLPADGRLLWQLGELAAVHGDVRTAAAILDGCVTEFGMRSPELRRHRQLLRAAADELARKPNDAPRAAHEGHALVLKPRSARPLANKLDTSRLPPVQATGVNELPWSVINATTLDRRFKPTFADYLKELAGRQVALSGYMQPLSDGLELGVFMLVEYPIGCWYCEMPEVTGIVLVEMPEDRPAAYARTLVRVEGKLSLNGSDPENFLYTIRGAKVSRAE